MENIRVYNTGNPTFLIMFKSENGGFEEGDVLYSYFEQDGINYVNGKVNRPPLNGNAILIAMIGEGLLPDGTPFNETLNGAPANAEIMISCLRDGVAYKVTPGSIHIDIGTELVRDKVTALPITLFHLRGLEINLDEEVILNEVPYFQWYSEQCPSWRKTEYSRTHMCHRMSENILNRNDGAQFKTIRRVPIRRIMPIQLATPINSNGAYYELIEGTGVLGNTHYDLSDDDIENRTKIVLRRYAKRRENCELESEPYADFIFHLEKLPYVPDQMIKIKDADPIQLETVEVDYYFDTILAEDNYFVVGIKDNFVAAVNKLNVSASCFIKEPGARTRKQGFGMRGGTYRVSNVSVIHIRNKGKVHEITFSATKQGITKTFTVTL